MNSLRSTCGRAACKEVFVARGYACYSIPYILRCLRDTSLAETLPLLELLYQPPHVLQSKRRAALDIYEAVWLGIGGTLPDNNGTPRNIS
jgi:hypothetical protein